MAATRATATGATAAGRTSSASRLGHASATGRADTWRTFSTCYIRADGSGYVEVKRDDTVIIRHDFGPE